ncbi:DUF5683 domain-containing protein [Saccharicrinis sp. FJH54]|uniref:DUF5683 domain-containing protein n=1 Tax=Saccharicrinis sp. FJH54 TaxID=3344665 RepID=UPI0035D4B05A
MKLLQKRNYIYLIFSLFIFSSSAQVGEQAYQFARQQFEKENFSDAAREFNRALFLGTQHTAESYRSIGECYFKTGAYDLSDIFYDKAYFALKDDSLKTEILLQKTYSNILRKRFSNAYYELVNVDSLYGSVQSETFWFYLGVVYYGMEDFDNARASFAKNFSPEEINQLDAQFAYLKKMQKRHRPAKVETMSYILPGLGQIYTGNIKEGANSFLLLSALMYGMIKVGIIYSGFDGLFLFGPWFQRYYMGGAEKAKHMAEHKLMEVKNEVFNQILEIGSEQ